MALENRELESFSSAQRQHLNQLLEISTELASTSRLDAFLQKFVVRAADFLGFARAFVAVADGGECRIHWGSINGVANRVDIDLAGYRTTKRIFETKEPYLSQAGNVMPTSEIRQRLRADYGAKQELRVPLPTGHGPELCILLL